MVFSGIYALIDPAQRAALPYVEALLAGGIRLFQIRAKAGIAPDLFAAILERAHAREALVIVNDNVTLGALADGVHLGQEDAAALDLAGLRARLGHRVIGLSCGTPAEARAVPIGLADYLGVGPIFATGSKGDAGAPIGASGVRAVVEATSLPVAAIGGITLARVPRVRETGAAMAAVISALETASDAGAAARAFLAAWTA